MIILVISRGLRCCQGNGVVVSLELLILPPKCMKIEINGLILIFFGKWLWYKWDNASTSPPRRPLIPDYGYLVVHYPFLMQRSTATLWTTMHSWELKLIADVTTSHNRLAWALRQFLKKKDINTCFQRWETHWVVSDANRPLDLFTLSNVALF